jgi:formylglycine-generating enzyme required for sulfatase activity
LKLGAFKISRYLVTHRQFQAFIDAPDGFYDRRWWKEWRIYDEPNEPKPWVGSQWFNFWSHPRDNVNWYDAIAFCRWLSFKLTGRVYGLNEVEQWPVRLPTEFEWEKAARGTDGRVYPYGNKFDSANGNTRETGLEQTSVVGMFFNSASPYGVLDMSGNVWEWCLSNYRNPSLDAAGEDLRSMTSRVLRGGSWVNDQDLVRAAYRSYYDPNVRSYNLGFRVVLVFPLLTATDH